MSTNSISKRSLGLWALALINVCVAHPAVSGPPDYAARINGLTISFWYQDGDVSSTRVEYGGVDLLAQKGNRMVVAPDIASIMARSSAGKALAWQQVRSSLVTGLTYDTQVPAILPLPNDAYSVYNTGEGHPLMIPKAFELSASVAPLLQIKTLRGLVQNKTFRTAIYRDVIIASLVGASSREFHADLQSVLKLDIDALDVFLGSTSAASSTTGWLSTMIRAARGSASQLGHMSTAADASSVRFEILKRVSNRVSKTQFARIGRAVGILAVAAEFSSAFKDASEARSYLQEASRDAVKLLILSDLHKLTLSMPNIDPAIPLGVEQAIGAFTNISHSWLQQVALSAWSASGKTWPSAAVFAIGYYASAGAAIVASETLSVAKNSMEITTQTLNIAAMETLGRYTGGALANMASGETVGAQSADTVWWRGLLYFQRMLSAEATAATYKFLWGGSIWSSRSLTDIQRRGIFALKTSFQKLMGADLDAEFLDETKERVRDVVLDSIAMNHAVSFVAKLENKYTTGTEKAASPPVQVAVVDPGRSSSTDDQLENVSEFDDRFSNEFSGQFLSAISDFILARSGDLAMSYRNGKKWELYFEAPVQPGVSLRVYIDLADLFGHSLEGKKQAGGWVSVHVFANSGIAIGYPEALGLRMRKIEPGQEDRQDRRLRINRGGVTLPGFSISELESANKDQGPVRLGAVGMNANLINVSKYLFSFEMERSVFQNLMRKVFPADLKHFGGRSLKDVAHRFVSSISSLLQNRSSEKLKWDGLDLSNRLHKAGLRKLTLSDG